MRRNEEKHGKLTNVTCPAHALALGDRGMLFFSSYSIWNTMS
jgi:hypothetical protein